MAHAQKSRRPELKGYRRLTIDDVIADLPSLDSDQLHFVESLEKFTSRRAPVLDGIAQLLASLGELEPLVVDIRPARPGRRRVRRYARFVAAVAALAAATYAAAGAVGGQKQAAPVATGRAAATVDANVTAVQVSGVAGEAQLVDRLVAAGVPAQYTQIPDAAGETRASALSAAAADDGTPGAQSFLSRAGFVQGVKRTWQTGDHHQLTVSIVQFADPTGAAADAKRRVAADRGNPQATVTGFAVDGIPGAVGLSAVNNDTSTETVYFTRGAYAARVSVNWYVGTGTDGTAQAVARAQYGLL